MIKEEYRTRMSEIYNQIGDLAAERDKLVIERMTLIREDLAKYGLKVGNWVAVITHDGKKYDCEFNDVRCNQHYHIYLEFTYKDVDFFTYGMEQPVDVNTIESVLILKSGIGFDYVPFMSKYQ